MQLIKTVLIVAVLAAVTYGVYAGLTGARDVPPPPGAPDDDLQGAPQIELPSVDTPAALAPPANLTAPPAVSAPPIQAQVAPTQPNALGEAPPYSAPAGEQGGSAPPFVAPNVGPGDPGGAPNVVPPAATPPAAAGPAASIPAAPSASMPVDPAALSPQDPNQAVSAPPGAVPGATAAVGNVPPPSEVPPPRDETAVSALSPVNAPADIAKFQTDYAAAHALLQERRLDQALQLLTQWYAHPALSEQEQNGLMELLYQLAGTVIYSREYMILDAYEVQPGDTLERVASQYRVPPQVLAKINVVADPNQLRPGDKLKVLPGPFHAVVDLRTHYLTLFLEKRFAGRFPIGVGSDQAAPEGDYVVKDKTPNPTYYGPDRVVDPSDPSNPLGKYWIGLGNQFGIHGTNDPQSIGRADARGCIRLNPRDIEDVYDMMTVESHVRILR